MEKAVAVIYLRAIEELKVTAWMRTGEKGIGGWGNKDEFCYSGF